MTIGLAAFQLLTTGTMLRRVRPPAVRRLISFALTLLQLHTAHSVKESEKRHVMLGSRIRGALRLAASPLPPTPSPSDNWIGDHSTADNWRNASSETV